jgi:septal ring factor EnvC (AmiA/AmiB activator)
MAKRRGVWADLQRERARRQRLEQQTHRATAQAAKKAEREREQARRAAARQAAQNERERKRLYIEERKAEAAGLVVPPVSPSGVSVRGRGRRRSRGLLGGCRR